MISTIINLTIVAALLFFAPVEVEARHVKLPRVGVLVQADDRSAPIVKVFEDSPREGLRNPGGFEEGKDVLIEYRAGPLEALPRLASDLVRLNVDVIFAGGTAAGLAAQKTTTVIPIVVVATADPVADGLVASLAKPGGNITGVTFLGPELGPKRLQLLKEVLPRLFRVAVLQHVAVYSQSTMREMLGSIRSAAAGIDVKVVEVRSRDDFDAAFVTIVKANVNALVILPSPMFYIEHRRLVAAANASRLPTIYWFREAVEAGGLMSYGANLPDVFRRSAVYVAKILRGAKAADLPVEQPLKFDLGINLRTAKALGLKIPSSLLLQADQVIE